MTKEANPDFVRFDAAMRRVLSVSHAELQRREKEWKRKRAQKKQTRIRSASRASGGRA
jgi:hypothetical protein